MRQHLAPRPNVREIWPPIATSLRYSPFRHAVTACREANSYTPPAYRFMPTELASRQLGAAIPLSHVCLNGNPMTFQRKMSFIALISLNLQIIDDRFRDDCITISYMACKLYAASPTSCQKRKPVHSPWRLSHSMTHAQLRDHAPTI